MNPAQNKTTLIEAVVFPSPTPVKYTARSFNELISKMEGIYAFTFFKDRRTAEEFMEYIYKNYKNAKLLILFDLEEDAKDEDEFVREMPRSRWEILRKHGFDEFKYMVFIMFE